MGSEEIGKIGENFVLGALKKTKHDLNLFVFLFFRHFPNFANVNLSSFKNAGVEVDFCQFCE